jgi:hypothetical protein
VQFSDFIYLASLFFTFFFYFIMKFFSYSFGGQVVYAIECLQMLNFPWILVLLIICFFINIALLVPFVSSQEYYSTGFFFTTI